MRLDFCTLWTNSKARTEGKDLTLYHYGDASSQSSLKVRLEGPSGAGPQDGRATERTEGNYGQGEGETRVSVIGWMVCADWVLDENRGTQL